MLARQIFAGALLLVLPLTASTAEAQFAQQGAKLVGTGAAGNAGQGRSVSVSADGNTAVVGEPTDNTNQGAAWVFVRSGIVWSQQGAKLVGTGAVGAARQGSSVSVSADGNTAVVGGQGDNGNQGAAWVYVRSGGVWSQQGAKLVGTGALGAANQGFSVSLSGDGNTAVVGGYQDNTSYGAAWVYVRSGGVWSQQGAKLVGTGGVSAVNQGFSVSLSGDGNTAVVGGYQDNTAQGATWVFVRSGSAWSQQGAKLVGTGAMGTPWQGVSVSVSADGNTAVVGGYQDNTNTGAAWVFFRATLDAPGSPLPREVSLAPVAPNPLRNGGTFRYALPRDAQASLAIYDASGRLVRLLARGVQPAGEHAVQWDGRDAAGQTPASGIYFVRLEAGGRSLAARFVRMR